MNYIYYTSLITKLHENKPPSLSFSAGDADIFTVSGVTWVANYIQK